MNSYLVAAIAAAALVALRFLIPVQPERIKTVTPPLTIGRIALAVFLGNLLTAAVVAAAYFLFTAK